MKKKMLSLVMMVFAVSSAFPTISWADQLDNREQMRSPGNYPYGETGPNHKPIAHVAEADRHNNGNDRKHHSGPVAIERDHFAWKGHDFRKGRPMPSHFQGQRYRVHDWRARGLQQPPSGHYWSYIDGNYVLIAATTGVITAIILNSAVNH
ncbi:RcnB family protein [Pectobacteriaceae bacterium CE90]|nr:RcnB family protein [Pectobacteriaceae bacterium CE90]